MDAFANGWLSVYVDLRQIGIRLGECEGGKERGDEETGDELHLYFFDWEGCEALRRVKKEKGICLYACCSFG